MDKKTVFVKTGSGESEVAGKSDVLYGDAKRILHLVYDESTVAEITKRAPPSLRDSINNVLQELVDGGYIRDMHAPVNEPKKSILKMASSVFKMPTPKAVAPTVSPPLPSNIPTPSSPSQVTKNEEPAKAGKGNDVDFSFISSGNSQNKKPSNIPTHSIPLQVTKNEEPAKAGKGNDVDFSFISSGNSQGKVASNVAIDKVQAASAAKARHEEAMQEEAEHSKAEQVAQIEAAAQAVQLKAYEDAKIKAQIEVAARAKIEEAARAKIEEAARAQQEADVARKEAEKVALKARIEADAAKSRIEAESRARIEAEARVKQEAEVIRLKAEKEAEKLRLELEEAKIKSEVEMRTRLEAEARVKAEAEAERLRLEQEGAELAVARVKVEAETKMRAEVEARLKAESVANHGDGRSHQQDGLSGAAGSEILAKVDEADQAEKLRQLFVESFGQNKKKQDVGSSRGNFQLEDFSLVNTGEIPADSDQAVKQQPLPRSGSKVKAVIEGGASKEAEAKRIKVEQASAHLSKERNEAARIRAQQEEADAQAKAEHEAYRLKVVEEEARAKAEVEAQKLTDAQAKQGEEEQRRAAVQAQAEQERLCKQEADDHAKAQRKPSRARRKSLPLGKILAGLFVLALVAVAVLPYVWPVDEYIAPLEKEISAKINQPVHIKKINFALLPMPRLDLHSVTVGKSEELKVGNVAMHFDFSALFAPTKSIHKMDLKNVTVAGSSLDKVMAWLQAAGGVEAYPVAQIELNGVRIVNDGIKLPSLSGKADFDPQGKFTHATLKSEDAKWTLGMQLQHNNLLLEINLKESSLPIFPGIKFNDLSTNAVVTNGEIVFNDFFAHIYGGSLTGKGRLNWGNGWRLQGQLIAKGLEMQRMFPSSVLSGEIFGEVNVSMASATLSQLDKDYRLEGSFETKSGVINKLDIEAIARFGVRQGLAGHTNFSKISGTIKADSNGQRIVVSKLASFAGNSTGLIDVDAKQQLSGKLLVDIKGLESGAIPLQLSGTSTKPILQSGR